MKSSKLKPKILTDLFELFELDPSPKAAVIIESVHDSIKEASPEKINRMLEHLKHTGLIDIRSSKGHICASINDKGIRWLDEYNEYLKQKSMKHWLIKPALVAFVVCIITTPIVIAIQGSIAIQSEPLLQDQRHNPKNTMNKKCIPELKTQSLSYAPK